MGDSAEKTRAIKRNAARLPDTTITKDVEVGPRTARAFGGTSTELDRYAVVSELARGGGGKIAVAVDRKLGRKVAIKRALDDGGNERLEREALVLAQLEHPAIVPLHDAGRDASGAPYFTMKLLGGRNLSRTIDQATTWQDRIALLPIVVTVAEAVAYAHEQRIVHRDLKPGNVMVGDFGEVALIDWGIARVLDEPEAPAPRTTPLPTSSLTAAGSVIGTPAYMAPEQAETNEVDERADVYALGAMLYHVLTGDVPFGPLDSEATLVRLLEGPPPRVETREPRVPDELATIVHKAMARRPDDRYRSARHLAEDLRRYQTGRLVAAHRYGHARRAWKAARRRPGRVAVAAVTVVAVAATILIVRARAHDEASAEEARRSRQEAQDARDRAVVDRARALVDRDPTAAIATLATLPPSSRLWPAARGVAIAARAAGIAVAFPAREATIFMRFSADGARLAALDAHAVQIHDLVHRTTTTISMTSPTSLAWFGSQLVIAGPTGLAAIDVATGRRDDYAIAGGVSYVTADARGARLGWITADHHAFVGAPGAGVELPSDGAVESLAIANDGHVLVRTATAAKLLRRSPAGWQLALALPAAPAVMSADGARVAAVVGSVLREWDTETGAHTDVAGEEGTIPTYVGERLLLSSIERHLIALRANGTTRVYPQALYDPFPDLVVPFDDRGGLAIASEDALHLATPDHAIEVRMPEGAMALAAHWPYVAAGTSSHVRIWDLREIWPAAIAELGAVDIRPLSPTRSIVFGADRSATLDLDGAFHEVAFAPPPLATVATSLGDASWRDPHGLHVVDSDGAPHVFPSTDLVSWARYGDDAIVALRGRELVIAPLDGRPPHVAAQVPIAGVVVAQPPWLAIVGEHDAWRDGRSVHLDGARHARFDIDGTLYIATGSAVLRWSAGSARPEMLASVAASEIAVLTKRDVIVIREDRSLALVDRRTGVIRQALAAGDRVPRIAVDGQTAAVLGDDRRIHVADLTSGDSWTMPVVTDNSGRAAYASVAQPSGEGRWLYLARTGLGPTPMPALALPIDLPRDERRLQQWVSTRTNGRLDASGALVWSFNVQEAGR